MLLRLETFTSVSVLVVRHSLGLEDARVLLAGVSKLTSLNRPWVLINLEDAVMDEPAINFLSQNVSHDTAANAGVQTVWVGDVAAFCRYPDLDTALKKIKVKEIREVSTKLDLEIQKEGLGRLLRGREKVTALLSPDPSPPAELEATYLAQNRNLRAAQTHLINRLLDPVYSDRLEEPAGDSKVFGELVALFGMSLNARAGNAVAATSAKEHRYEATEIAQLILRLREDVKALQSQAQEPFMEGKADRLVSLMMEHETLNERIGEVREEWLRRLEFDSESTRSDVEAGLRPVLEAQKKLNQETKESA